MGLNSFFMLHDNSIHKFSDLGFESLVIISVKIVE
jgi:hypothetical protein